jgi:hypothetical protein
VSAVELNTTETIKRADASVLVVEAGRTLKFNRKEMIQAPDDAKIAIHSMSADEEALADLDGLGLESMRLGAKASQARRVW